MQDNKYNIILENQKSTVVAEFVPDKKRAENYQSESDLEKAFIKQLESQEYQYLNITKEDELISNLRKQIERLNDITFSDKEWNSFFKNEIAKPNQIVVDKTQTIQEDYIKHLIRDDRTTKNIYLINKENIHDNCLQVINQYETDAGKRTNRYDVTILVNGLPLVHTELKRRGVAITDAFNQINRYKRESFWASNGLFDYVQLFVISNGTHTKYYSNTVREEHIKEVKGGNKKKSRSGNSFEFTNYWADQENRSIDDLMDFTKTFFAKHSLLAVLTRYCVFTSNKQLLVMRPYQIVATEKILNKIEMSINNKKLGSVEAGGYVWHTTGSGKTLTSFKTSILASKLKNVDKVLFVVDRKDLDYQTIQEYDKFEKGAANSNANTSKLKEQLEDESTNIIITTIQKLDRFIKGNAGHGVFEKNIVIIFDECHRSQFGDMHENITKKFKNYNLFGFTGTPIFAANAPRSSLQTTEKTFGERLHTYTIVNAINDKNVLPFKVEYISTIKKGDYIVDKKVSDIDREAALVHPRRLENVVEYIREHFNQKTYRSESYNLQSNTLKGFNSIFAVSSIDVAKKYYAEFQKQLADVPSEKKLKVALIYSFGVNDDDLDGLIDENSDDAEGLDKSSRDFLDDAIKDYNDMFGTEYDTSISKFSNYYANVSKRVKEKEIDILIVVNMFLTGFDAPTLNTLWVDKKLQSHGLLQAFSRTNRIINTVKTFGNIVCFRDLSDEVDRSISLFGDKDSRGIILLKTYEEYYNGYNDGSKYIRGYTELIKELHESYPVGKKIVGEQEQKDFIRLYSAILRVYNTLITFDQFEGNEILDSREMQDYQSMYIDLYNEFRAKTDSTKENINDDLIFEMELIKQADINIDYVLNLIIKYHEDNVKNKEILIDIKKAVNSSIELRNKRDLIEQFIDSHQGHGVNHEDWYKFIDRKRLEEFDQIIEDEDLNRDEAYTYMRNVFRSCNVNSHGTDLVGVLKPMGVFNDERGKKKKSVLDKFIKFFDKFYNISNSDFSKK